MAHVGLMSACEDRFYVVSPCLSKLLAIPRMGNVSQCPIIHLLGVCGSARVRKKKKEENSDSQLLN